MTFLDDVIAQLVDNSGATNADRSIEHMFGALFRGVPGGIYSTGVGGLPGLVTRFERIGFGPIIHSWMGSGPKMPITPAQLRAVLDDGLVKSIAEASAREEHDILDELCLLLPGVVARLTHHGVG